MRPLNPKTIRLWSLTLTVIGLSAVLGGILRAQQSGQLASDILGSTDMSYNPTFFGYSLHGGPTAHSVA
jgi:hypothetical protein